jgi:hypothetical protein
VGVATSSILLGFGFGLVIFVIAAILAVKVAELANHIGRIEMKQWLSSVDNCKYKYAFDGTGIAIDANARVIYLASQMDKELFSGKYPFSDIRNWESTIAGKWDAVVSPGVAGTAGMVGRNALLEEDTGLWVTVRDTDRPKWFIKFGNNPALGASLGSTRTPEKVKHELARWMEILKQALNEQE